MVDLKEEQKYKRLRKLAQELHIPMPEHFITLEVFDRNGKLIQKHRQRSHSWTRNAYNMMFCGLAGKDADDDTFGAGKLNIKKQDGAVSYGNYCPVGAGGAANTVDDPPRGYRAAAGVDIVGILVGKDATAESFEDYKLISQLTEGVGVDQISHVASDPHIISYADTTLTNSLVRYFNNNTGTSREINEVGLAWATLMGMAGLSPMVSRDKLTSTVTVPDTGQLKVTYTIELAYPA